MASSKFAHLANSKRERHFSRYIGDERKKWHFLRIGDFLNHNVSTEIECLKRLENKINRVTIAQELLILLLYFLKFE